MLDNRKMVLYSVLVTKQIQSGERASENRPPRIGGIKMRKMQSLGLEFVVMTLVALLCNASPAWGQEVTASITGTVMDPSGAAVAGATVTAKSVERGLTYTAVTNESGIYRIAQLPVGSYELKVEKSGFASAAFPAFVLTLNQVARVDVGMKVGQVTQTVEVTGAAPVLKTEATQVDTIINSATNDNLPLASRNYVQLTLLAPGAVSTDPSSFNNGNNTGGYGGRPLINGNREQANYFLLDGMDNNQVSDNLLGYTPAPDAIQEFNLITNNASAEFGNFMGGIVNATIKSGTNSYHGDVWEFFRNDKLNANSWSNNFNTTAGVWDPLPKSKLRWNMFGATLGGPILKNKLFFFVDYQGQRFDIPSTSSFITVFTNAERNGDFSQVSAKLVNPITKQPYANNQITSPINAVAKNLFASSFYPKPINNQPINNAVNSFSQAFNTNQGDAKVDYNLTGKDRISGRYSQAYQDDPSSTSLLILGNGFAHAPIHNAVGTWTHTFSPSILNEARFGANWVTLQNGTTFDSSIGNLGTTLGIANANTVGPGLLLLGFGGGTAPAPGTGTLTNVGSSVIRQNFADTVIQFDVGVTYTHGKHVIKTGFQMWRYRVNTFYSGNSGEYGSILFGGSFSGDAGADFYLGYPVATGKGVSTGGTWHQFSWTYAGYVQDNWRVTPTLTLNVGLRYEAHTPWVELNNRQDNLDLVSGKVLYAGVDGNSRSLYNSVYGQPAIQ